jgi:EmrB/QacA subfamily drug resistance transporter
MEYTDRGKWKALAVLGVAYLMVVLDISIVNVALPSIETDLDFTPANLQWVVSAYSLTFGGLLLLGGRAGDLLGRRRVFMAGLALFSLSSLVCGLSQSDTMLIVARGVQGAAAAILSPSVFSIVMVTFKEGAERNKALGILGGIAGAGGAIGVLAGGVLTQYAGWEWIFFVNVPIGLATLALVHRVVHESRLDTELRHFDAQGAVVITTALLMLVYAITQANSAGWGSLQTVGLISLSVILIGVFVWIESRSPAPLVPLRFFRKRTPTGANIVGFGLGSAIFGMFLLQSLYMQQVLGFSALRTGVYYLAVALTAIVASGISQALVTKIGVRTVLAIGLSTLTAGLLYFTQISVHGTYWNDLFPGFILVGIGLGFSFVPVSIAALAGVERDLAGLASGLINTSQQIGGALGVAILVTVANSRISDLVAGGTDPLTAQTEGYARAFFVGAGLAAVSLAATFVFLKSDELEEAAEAAHAPAG